LVFAGGGKRGELNTVDFGADCGGEVAGFYAWEENVWVLGIGVKTVFGVCEGLEGWVFFGGIPVWEVVLVLPGF